jgi:hypothetical protein
LLTYDEPNDLVDMEQPVVRAILDGWPAGIALDAACGTAGTPLTWPRVAMR